MRPIGASQFGMGFAPSLNTDLENIEGEIILEVTNVVSEVSIVGRIRVLLSMLALLRILIDPTVVYADTAWGIFFGYVLYSVAIHFSHLFRQSFWRGKISHWLDVGWYAAMVFLTGGMTSVFVIFFFFAIGISSFRWGFKEGVRVTLASCLLFVIDSMIFDPTATSAQLALLALSMLTLGYMIAYWGGAEVAKKNQLMLLHDISQLSNPRFGVDQTIVSVMEKTRVFFNGSNCILLTRDHDLQSWSLRTAMNGYPGSVIKMDGMHADVAARLMVLAQHHLLVYTQALSPWLSWTGRSQTYDSKQEKWSRHPTKPAAYLAELLEARSFITVPLALMKGEGRLYVVSSTHAFNKMDVVFLNRIQRHAFPMIENIELLDHLASEAAARERRKIARDLHDTAIQSYIGFQYGLGAMRNKAAADNPLIGDLDKLREMVIQAVGDLRTHAGRVKTDSGLSEPTLLAALRRQAGQFKAFYGIDIDVRIDGTLTINDRLAVEIFQVANEAMSNICKHTSARCGVIKLRCTKGWLAMAIENESSTLPVSEFMPRSIVERAAALGGKAYVDQGVRGKTIVHVDIPV